MRTGDGVSPIMITGNDFAGAWAIDENGDPLLPTVPSDPTQRMYAYRAGVNIMMYMLTGNYKSDQVHVPVLLERLGQCRHELVAHFEPLLSWPLACRGAGADRAGRAWPVAAPARAGRVPRAALAAAGRWRWSTRCCIDEEREPLKSVVGAGRRPQPEPGDRRPAANRRAALAG